MGLLGTSKHHMERAWASWVQLILGPYGHGSLQPRKTQKACLVRRAGSQLNSHPFLDHAVDI